MVKGVGVKMKVSSRGNEGCKVLWALKGVVWCSILCMEANKGLYEQLVVPTTVWPETWRVRAAEQERLNG